LALTNSDVLLNVFVFDILTHLVHHRCYYDALYKSTTYLLTYYLT